MRRRAMLLTIAVFLRLEPAARASAAEVTSDWPRVVAGAKQEGKVVIGAPPGSDFRNAVQAVLKKPFDLDSEFIQAPGPNLMSKIAAEKKAGVASVDAFLIGPCTGNSLLNADLFEPLAAAMILPEVKDPAKWFGGHLWADNQTGRNLLYSCLMNPDDSNSCTKLMSTKLFGSAVAALGVRGAMSSSSVLTPSALG